MSDAINDFRAGVLRAGKTSPSSSTLNAVAGSLEKHHAAKVFVPFSEAIVARHGMSLGDLVPFRIQYTCLRLAESAEQYGWSDVEIEQPA